MQYESKDQKKITDSQDYQHFRTEHHLANATAPQSGPCFTLGFDWSWRRDFEQSR